MLKRRTIDVTNLPSYGVQWEAIFNEVTLPAYIGWKLVIGGEIYGEYAAVETREDVRSLPKTLAELFFLCGRVAEMHKNKGPVESIKIVVATQAPKEKP